MHIFTQMSSSVSHFKPEIETPYVAVAMLVCPKILNNYLLWSIGYNYRCLVHKLSENRLRSSTQTLVGLHH